jgi:AAA domain
MPAELTTEAPAAPATVKPSSGTSILSGITKGRRKKPIFALVYGTDGVGKTTFCSHAPNPLFIGGEKGTDQLDVARLPRIGTVGELLSQLKAISTEKHDFNSLVLDSVDWLEPLIWRQVCAEGKVTSIEDYGGGYGKGYVRASEIWRGILEEFGVLAERFHVLLIGHALIKAFQDPDLPTGYDRYILKVNEKAASLIRESVDVVLFAKFEVEVLKDKGSRKARGVGDGSRIMYTERRPAFDAKNRYDLPFEMDLEWQPFADAIKAFYSK